MLDRLFAKLEKRDRLNDDERAALEEASDERRRFGIRSVIVPQGVPQTRSSLLLDGYVARVKSLADGQRQITTIHIPGDFLDLPSFLTRTLDHDLVALTDVRLACYPHDRLARMTETRPHLARMLWLGTMIDAAITREMVLTIGRRDARARVAHLFCELHARHDVVGLAPDGTLPWPFTQADVGEATGLTSVHVNRMIRRLREQGLIELKSRTLFIRDLPGLEAAAEFDPTYLYLDRRPT